MVYKVEPRFSLPADATIVTKLKTQVNELSEKRKASIKAAPAVSGSEMRSGFHACRHTQAQVKSRAYTTHITIIVGNISHECIN